jgi:uncharacterized C2H2 Zn-finger protein
MAGLTRQQKRMLERKNEKAARVAGVVSDARVMAFAVGYFDGITKEEIEERRGRLGNAGADVKCGRCDAMFRFSEIEVRDFVRDVTKAGIEEQAPASTGAWSEGRCPECGHGHRVRATVAIIVEEEASEEEAPILEELRGDAGKNGSGLILPGKPGIITPS